MTSEHSERRIEERGGRPSSKAFYGMGDCPNPYAKYQSSDDGDSLDDGINMDDKQFENGDGPDSDQMPDEDVILREFYDYMEVMSPMSEPETLALNRTSLVEKWSLVYNQQCRSPVFPLRHYISNLRRHNDSRRRTFSWSRGSTDKDGVSKLAHLLRKLKADMKLSSQSFPDEFCEKSNDGVKMLLKLLAEIQSDKNSASTSRKQKNDEYKRAVIEEYDCLLCLKFAQRSQTGLIRFFELDGAIDAIVSVIYGENIKSLAVALDILCNLCGAAGSNLVLKALAEYSMKHAEFRRFKPLVSKLQISTHEQEIYTLSFMKLMNQIREQENDIEGKVSLHFELGQAEFDITDVRKMAHRGSMFGREIQKEMDTWNKGAVRIKEFAKEISSLQQKNTSLRQEIDHLQEEIKTAGNKLDEVSRVNKEKNDLRRDSRASEIIATLENLKFTNTGSPNRNMKEDVSSTVKPLDPPAMDRGAPFRRSLKQSTSSSPDDALSLNSFDSSVSIPDAPPPPAPLPPKIQANGKNNNLPILHWTPLYNVMGTVFQNVDNKLLQEADFSEFEEKFKADNKSPEKLVRKMSSESSDARISFVDANRAKNLLITLRRIGRSPDEICHAIDACDSKVLSGEDAELLSKFIPTKEERNMMLQHTDSFDQMGEAEQIMYKMAKVERLDSKIAVLVSMGSLVQQLNQLRPRIGNVNESALSVKKNKKLLKIFEVILIFGNYMNSGKKGYAMGFKLESLSRLNTIKGKDNLSFMHFLVDFLQRKFPWTVDFYHELSFSSDSFQTILAELQDLRKNLELIRFERSQQTTNGELQKFANLADKEIAEVGDHFRKMEASYKEVCRMFGETHKDTAGPDVLANIQEFAENFKKTVQEQTENRDGPKSPVDRSIPPTPPGVIKSPAAGITALLLQSEKFQRALQARKELEDTSGDQETEGIGTSQRKSLAPPPPAMTASRESADYSGRSSPNVEFQNVSNRPKSASSDSPRTSPVGKSPVNSKTSPAPQPDSAVQNLKSPFSKANTPSGRNGPPSASSSSPPEKLSPPAVQPKVTPVKRTSPPESDQESSPIEGAVQRGRMIFSNASSSSPEGNASVSSVSPKTPVYPSNNNKLHNTDSPVNLAQAKVTPVKKESPGIPEKLQTPSPGARMVFPAKSPAQNKNASSHSVDQSTPRVNAAEVSTAKVTPPFGKKMNSPNLSNVLPNKTSPANIRHTPNGSPYGVTSPSSNAGSTPSSSNTTQDRPVGNVQGLVKSFSKENTESTGSEKPATITPKRLPSGTPNQTPSPQATPPAKSPAPGSAGKVIRKNSILFSAKSPVTSPNHQNQSNAATGSPITASPSPRIKPKAPAIPGSTPSPNTAIPGPTPSPNTATPKSTPSPKTAIPGSTSSPNNAIPGSTSSPKTAIPGSTPSPNTTIPGSTPSPNTAMPGSTPSPNTAIPRSTPSPKTAIPGSTPSPNTAIPRSTPSPKTAIPGSTPSPNTATPGSTPSPKTAIPGSTPSPNTAIPGSTSSPNTAIPVSTPSPNTAKSSQPLDENQNQGSKSVKDIKQNFERSPVTSSHEVNKTMNDFDKMLQEAGVAEETVNSYL